MEVSVVTPTYNRRMFIPTLIDIYKAQTFPKEKMEWIIIDDGRDKVEDLFKEACIPNLRYIRVQKKMRLGAKRNMLNKEATGAIIVAMDDDDYYPPTRVSSVVEAFQKNPTIELAGSSEMNLYYMDTKKIYTTGPYGKYHATNGTMAWRKSYANTHSYNEYVTHAEETSYLDNYTNKMIQLDPLSTILVICHTDNTVDKNKLRNSEDAFQFRESSYKLDDIVVDKKIRDFYTA